MLTPEQERQNELASSFGEYIEFSLKTAHEDVAEKALSIMISKGLPISAIIEGLANICDKRNYNKATGFLEQASEEIRQDE